MAVLHVGKNEFEQIKSSSKTVLLDFYADWCGPCKMLSPIIEKLAEEHPEYVIAKINVDQEPELAQSFGVISIPTLVVMREGKVVHTATGVRPKGKILELLEK